MTRVMDPRAFYAKLIDSMRLYWAAYLGLDNVRMPSSFCPEDVLIYRSLLEASGPEELDLILARSGVKYVYAPDSGFKELPAALARAMVFYQAEFLTDQHEAIQKWSDPKFPADKVLLLSGGSRPVQAGEMPGGCFRQDRQV